MVADEAWDIGLSRDEGFAIALMLRDSGLIDFLNIIRGHIESDNGLLDVIPIDGTAMIKGSHGILTDDSDDGPLVMTNVPELLHDISAVDATAFKDLVLQHVFAI